MDAAVKRATPSTRCYQRHCPERTLWYRTVQTHFETWLELLWAMLLARIYEAFPLACPICHAQMRIISFITDASTVRKIIDHIGESTQPPRIAPARWPPLWEAAMAHLQAGNDHQWDMAAQPVPEFEFDQRIAW